MNGSVRDLPPSRRDWVVLFGGIGREAAVEALAARVACLRGVFVPAKPSGRFDRSVERFRAAGLPVVPCDRSGVDAALLPHAGSPLLSIGFPYILPAALLARHPLALNVHPTLLPAYRGPTSGAYIIMNGERQSGSTVHLLEAEVDSGDIVAQSRVTLSRFDTVRSMQRKVYATEPELLREALDRLDAGLPNARQDPALASIYPKKRTPEDSRIDPARPLIDLFDAIRACDPEAYPAFFEVDGQKVCVRLWRPERPEGDGPDTI